MRGDQLIVLSIALADDICQVGRVTPGDLGLPSRCLGSSRTNSSSGGLALHSSASVVAVGRRWCNCHRCWVSMRASRRDCSRWCERASGKPSSASPRHPTWFSARADALMRRNAIARVVADPAIAEEARAPGGWNGVAYLRLHSAPVWPPRTRHESWRPLTDDRSIAMNHRPMVPRA
jgi:hypothetical protein